MQEIEKKVFELIVKLTRQKLAKELGIDHRTLKSRIEKGGWLKSEIEIIDRLIA